MNEFKDKSVKYTQCPSCHSIRLISVDEIITTCTTCGWAYKTKTE